MATGVLPIFVGRAAGRGVFEVEADKGICGGAQAGPRLTDMNDHQTDSANRSGVCDTRHF